MTTTYFLVEKHSRFRRFLPGALAAVILTAVYAIVQLHDDNVALRAQVHTMKSTGCAPAYKGAPLAKAFYSPHSLRPRHSALTCFYSKGKMA